MKLPLPRINDKLVWYTGCSWIFKGLNNETPWSMDILNSFGQKDKWNAKRYFEWLEYNILKLERNK